MPSVIRTLVAPGSAARLLWVLFGSCLAGSAIQAFFVPAKLLPAGLSGLTVLLAYVSPIPAGATLLVLNIPIFWLGWKKVDADFVVWSLFGMLGFTGSLYLGRPLADLHLMDDFYLNGIAGAVVVGVGTGIVFRARASQGGVDVLAAVIRRRVAIGIAPLLFGLNAVSVLALAFVHGLQAAVATALFIWMETVVIERTIIGVDPNKAMMIVTARGDEVARALSERLNRTATVVPALGGDPGTKQVLFCVVNTRQLVYARALVAEVDPDCFTTVHTVTEVIGGGFKPLPI